ncbi:MAG: hypothetical protein HYS81_00305 [Candidatus Aenigmatarchaeota archaeon]|nr:MAG: hypothetical protein HYS81_00305 [Candidatus Aenigmarchaeota archaeon]
MDDRKLNLVYVALAIAVGAISAFVPKYAAYALGIVAFLAAAQLTKKVPDFKKKALGLAFMYVFIWIIVWTLATNL